MDKERKSKIEEKDFKFFSNALTFLTVLCLLIFFSSFGFRDSRTSGWYQQWFPNLNGSTITSMTFLDSLTGYAVTNSNSLLQQYILKTTNGGDNWIINYTYNTPNSNWDFRKIHFLNNNTGFAFSWEKMFNTTNGGNNWNIINYNLYPADVAVINTDTMLAVQNSGFDGGVYRSTNGGINWQPLGPTGGSGQPSKIYMFDKNIGFNWGTSGMKKTTNGGVNWFLIPNETFVDVKLIDSLNGWRCNGDIKKTTDGGITWILQQPPQIFVNSFVHVSLIDVNKLWGVGGSIIKNNLPYGVMYKTTNGGINWGYQVTDTSIHIGYYEFIQFKNNNIGWVYRFNNSGVHTTIGGSDTTFFTNINEPITNIASDFVLYQNYPNPFNSMTNVKVQMLKQGFAEIKVFDITGKLIKIILKQKLNTGEHKMKFDASDLTSGIYFYTLFIDDVRIDTKKMVLIK